MLACIVLLWAAPVSALVVELKDAASDRIERQRAWLRGQTPADAGALEAKLASAGVTSGSPVFLRIFKAESELELWVQKGAAFVRVATYPVCHWTGTLGPKLREGDKQSPEGFYSVTQRQMRHSGRWRKAFNLGFPNALDQRLQRTGSYILLHGGCSSTGCFAMTDPVMAQIHDIAQAALRGGQQRIHVHVFPFRMTDRQMDRHGDHVSLPFWRDLKAGYDAFERTHVPPSISVCEKRYVVRDGEPGTYGDVEALQRAGDRAACRTGQEQQAHAR